MQIELTKEVAVALLRGVVPDYDVMDKIPEDLGRYVGGFTDSWKWNYFDTDTKHTTEELYELYLLCQNSWKD